MSNSGGWRARFQRRGSGSSEEGSCNHLNLFFFYLGDSLKDETSVLSVRWLHTRGVCMACRGFMTDGVCEHYYCALSHAGLVDRSSPWKADLRRSIRVRHRAPLVTQGKAVRRVSAPMPYESPDVADAKRAGSNEKPGHGGEGPPELESVDAEECPSGPASSHIGRSRAASYLRLGDAALLNAPLSFACIVHC